MFSGCTALNGIIGTGSQDERGGLLSGCIYLTNVNYMFANCHRLKGAIPQDLFYTEDDLVLYNNLRELTGLFEGCTSLTVEWGGGPSIANPERIYGNVSDTSRYFVPVDWLRKCPNLTYVNRLFLYVGNPYVSTDLRYPLDNNGNPITAHFIAKGLELSNSTFSN